MSLQQGTFLRIFALYTIVILVLSSANAISAVSAETENLCSGPYVDKVVYTSYPNENDRVTALMSGDADALIFPVDPSFLSSLDLESDIDIYSMVDNGLRYIGINCMKYPLNISGFRRAFAYAFDKNQVVSEVLDGHAIAHDSVVSVKKDWCIEDQLPWHYYTNQSALGNQILDTLNFTIDGGTGWRLAPDGSTFTVILVCLPGDETSIGIAEKAAVALNSLSIETDIVEDAVIFSNVDWHYDYDMVVYKDHYYERDFEWILDNYYSQNSVIPYKNPSNYRNDTFDSLREAVLSAPTEGEFLEAVSDIQKHLHENVPVLIVCHDIKYHAYENTYFTGYVEDDFWGIPGPWTNVKVHNKMGSVFGGAFDIAIGSYPITFNMFRSDAYSIQSFLSSLYSGVYKMGPHKEIYLDLAKEVDIETHSTNIAVPEGQTWVKVEVKDGIVWSDGTPLTCSDVAFTFTYLYEIGLLGRPAGVGRWTDDFLSSDVLSPNIARIKLDRDSYYTQLAIGKMLLTKIIPEHIFNDDTGIGYAGWLTWDPVLTSDPFVTCGPFYLSAHDSLSFELSRNMDYYWPSGLAPKILSSADVDYIQGTTGNQIVWEVTDEDPNDYTIYRNGSLLETDDWNGSNIIHNVDGLSVGSYNYTLVLTDLSGHRVNSTVWVTVSMAGIPDMPDILLIATIVGSSIVIIVAVVLIYKKR
jgi:peptide/nickel transport system substrate-binding protein